MPTEYPGPLVSQQWLSDHLNDDNICIVDATVHLPDTGRNAKKEFTEQHIPNAIFFDLSDIADPDNPLPRKVPDKDLFSEKVGKLGIDNSTHVIAYDTPGLYSAARVWWLFRLYGYDNVSILDGGLHRWKQCQNPTTDKRVSREPSDFRINETRDLLSKKEEVLVCSTKGETILDARTLGRFSGKEADRYPGTRPGHIPGSANLYWANLLNSETRELLSKADLEETFKLSGIDVDQPIVLTCGSGLTACILGFALDRIGKSKWKIYDGSWDEWGRDQDLPIEIDN